MPGENKKLYISTTLYVVIFTTIVFGGLTEPIMNRMGKQLIHAYSTYMHMYMHTYIHTCAIKVREPMSLYLNVSHRHAAHDEFSHRPGV